MSTSNPEAEVPGEATGTGTAILESVTSAVQSFGPINKIHQHLCAYVTNLYIYIHLHYFCYTYFTKIHHQINKIT